MRELTVMEADMIAAADGDSGSSSGGEGATAGDYVGGMANAACGVYFKKVRGATACAAAGTFIGDLVDAADGYEFTVSDVGDPMDTKLGK